MKEFIAIDFETANPKRVSACSIGYAKVSGGQMVDSQEYLVKPVGGHAPFQSKIHGIKEEHTSDKPTFGELYPTIADIFQYPLVAHSLFDKQVLNALSDHFGLGLDFDYTDTCSVAKERLPNLKNHKLKTLAKHFECPAFKHHNAEEDACTCAEIFLKLQGDAVGELVPPMVENVAEFKGMIKGILADNEVNYKEAYELLYWMEDHEEIANHYESLFAKTLAVLEDDHLDDIEATELRRFLGQTLKEVEQTN
jgi:DNA polymerase-3 subunit epsilon